MTTKMPQTMEELLDDWNAVPDPIYEEKQETAVPAVQVEVEDITELNDSHSHLVEAEQGIAIQAMGPEYYLESGEPSWEEIRSLHKEIERNLSKAAVKAAKIGAMLNIKKLTTPHGEFGALVEQYCEVGTYQAQRYMRIAELRPDLVNYDPLSGLPVPSIKEIFRFNAPEQTKKEKALAKDAERKRDERAYKSTLKAIAGWDYKQCEELLNEARKRMENLRPTPQHNGYQDPPKTQYPTNGKHIVTLINGKPQRNN